MKVRIAGYKKHSMVNGPGVRFVLFLQGCPHHCRGCQNPDTWDPAGGQEAETERLIELIARTRYLDGITLSGGDPLCQPAAAAQIAQAARQAGLSVWCYTGWTLEQVLAGEAGPAARDRLLPLVDVLVDGPFEEEKLSDACIWRGSTGQRLIDVKASLAAGHACLADPDAL